MKMILKKNTKLYFITENKIYYEFSHPTNLAEFISYRLIS